jgi:hypothetical protein
MAQITADEVVRRIDETRQAEQFRNPDRPDARTLKRPRRQPIEVVRAKGRIRTATYRNKMDADRRPTTSQIGVALVLALATAETLNRGEMRLVGRALADLQRRGFDIAAAKESIRRIRDVHRGPMDS